MALINTVNKANGFVLRTYKAKNGKVTHILESTGGAKSKRVIKCDTFENPYKIIIATGNGRKEIYEKAPDGTTIMKVPNCLKGEKILEFKNTIFNTLCAKLFK